MENSGSILLNTGTNEVEIVEFGIQKAAMGINVIKVKEIINAVEPTAIPMSHPFLEGIIQLRGDIIPVIDLGRYLNFEPSSNPKEDKFIVTEFNKGIYAFHVHTVSRIHRLSWEQIDKPTDVFQGSQNSMIGIIRIDNKMILLLDFEKIMHEVTPELGIPEVLDDSIINNANDNVRIMIAEDSPMLRALLKDYLPKLGYNKVSFFQNGKEAWEYLHDVADRLGENFAEEVSILITDIEMPQMDGHYLTRLVKEHPQLNKLPVVIFSSLITERLRHKGESVGADAQISKPEYEELAKLIKQFCV